MDSSPYLSSVTFFRGRYRIQVWVLFLVLLLLIVLLITILLLAFLLGKKTAESPYWPSHDSPSILGNYEKAAVSTDAAPCALVGKDLLEQNGSAIDAAIATLVCMGVNMPSSMGLGGGFLMLYYKRSANKVYYIDSREVAPRNANTDMFNGNETLATRGGLSIAVPGELAGYEKIHKKFGRLPWKDLFKHSIKMCREGIVVSKHLAKQIKLLQLMTQDEIEQHKYIRDTFLKNGTDLYKVGDRIKLPKLARTLEEISKQGKEAIYGPTKMADGFLKDLKAAGSIIDHDDMSEYTPLLREPVKIRLRDNITFYGASMPGSGAILALMLGVLDGYPELNADMLWDLNKATLNLHRMVEAFKFAYGHRSRLEDMDSPEAQELIANLTSRSYADYIRSQISDTRTYNDSSYYGFELESSEDHGTSHLSIVAPDGDAVAVTSTINNAFGSLVLSPSTGIVLNNEMADFNSPNITTSFGVLQTDRNTIRPGKRPVSSACPSIFIDGDGNAKLVVGASGGFLSPTSVLQVALSTLFLGKNIKESIDAPRLHHQLLPDFIRWEPKAFSIEIVERLLKFGHRAKPWTENWFSSATGIARDNGILYANADYRKEGNVSGF